MKRRLGFISLLLTLSLVATGCLGLFSGNKEVAVSGTVTVDGAAPGEISVEVVVEGTSNKTKAGTDGKFTFQLVPGDYKLTAQGEGLEPATVSVNVQKNKPVSGIKIAVESIEEPDPDPDPDPEPFTLHMDFENPDHVALITKPWDSVQYEIKDDAFGDTALYFPKGSQDQVPPEGHGFKDMRFVLLDVPELDTFSLSLKQIGDGGGSGGNRSLSMVFGYEDIDNWWVVYYTYTGTTRVARMVDAKQINVCRPGDTDQWVQNDEEYQLAEIEVVREGNEMVVYARANGEPVSIDNCRFPIEDYTPGKIGLGGHSHSTAQSWFFKDIVLEEILD